MTSYTAMNMDRFHSSESVAGSGAPRRCRNCARIGIMSSGFAKPSAARRSASSGSASSAIVFTCSSTSSGSMNPA